MPSLALGSLDLVLGDQYPFLPRAPDPRLDLEPLLEEQFHVMLPREHPLAATGGPRPDRGAQATSAWAIGKDDSHYAELTIRACRTFGGFEPDVRHRSNDLLMLLALVANGQAVTLLPDLVRAGSRAVGGHPRRRRGAADPHRVRRDPPRQRPAAGAQCTASGAAGHGGWPSVGSHARTRKPPGAWAAVSPPPIAAASSATSSSSAPRAVVGDLHGQRAGHVLDRHGGRGRRLGRGQRVAHHAVGAAVHDVGDAARLAGTVERHRSAAPEGLYVIQAGHAHPVLRAISEMTLMDPEM